MFILLLAMLEAFNIPYLLLFYHHLQDSVILLKKKSLWCHISWDQMRMWHHWIPICKPAYFGHIILPLIWHFQIPHYYAPVIKSDVLMWWIKTNTQHQERMNRWGWRWCSYTVTSSQDCFLLPVSLLFNHTLQACLI